MIMEILGYSIPYTSCIKAEIQGKDLLITAVALIAISATAVGSLHLTGVISFALPSHQAFFIGFSLTLAGGAALTIDCVIARVKRRHILIAINEDTNEGQKALCAFNNLKEAFNDLQKFGCTEQNAGKLIEYCELLQEAIGKLSKQNRKPNKPLINEILKLKIQIKKNLVASEQEESGQKTSLNDQQIENKIRNSLKNLQTAALSYYFKETLDEQAILLAAIKKKFEENRKDFANHEDFIQLQLIRYQKKLDHGKPISIPKWYHCTKNSNVVDLIINSEIKVMWQQAYKGSFVSNRIQTIFGSFGFALSNRIEKVATRNYGIFNRTRLPDYSMGDPAHLYYGKETKHLGPDDSCIFWFGFRKPIPMLRPQIENNPLKFYRETTISFIYEQINKNFDSPVFDSTMKAIAKQHRVTLCTVDELNSLRELIHKSYKLTVPASWENNLVSCGCIRSLLV